MRVPLKNELLFQINKLHISYINSLIKVGNLKNQLLKKFQYSGFSTQMVISNYSAIRFQSFSRFQSSAVLDFQANSPCHLT
jgi:hypothetical protein